MRPGCGAGGVFRVRSHSGRNGYAAILLVVQLPFLDGQAPAAGVHMASRLRVTFAADEFWLYDGRRTMRRIAGHQERNKAKDHRLTSVRTNVWLSVAQSQTKATEEVGFPGRGTPKSYVALLATKPITSIQIADVAKMLAMVTGIVAAALLWAGKRLSRW
jgi:hypothetical protein